MEQILYDLLKADMKPALGCTEPSAIALVCAKARSLTKEAPRHILVETNSGVYKNAFTCGIPGTATVGNEYAAVLGTLCGDAERGLCALEGVTPQDVEQARQWMQSGKVEIHIQAISSELFIRATIQTEHDVCIAQLNGMHTNFTLLRRNDEVLLSAEYHEEEQPVAAILRHSMKDLVAFASTAPLERLCFVDQAFEMNVALAQEAVGWEQCCLTRALLKENGNQLISPDARASAKALTGAAIEARFLGAGKPAMSITGSGAHGIICTLPLYAAQQALGHSHEALLRATALSFLVTMYIKECSGKLSAFCGCGVAGGLGAACGLALMQGADSSVLERVFINMASSITGMICTGGNQGCVMKALAAVDIAFTSIALAQDGGAVSVPNGICANTLEKTAQNIGRIASPGMVETEGVILDIIQENLPKTEKSRE